MQHFVLRFLALAIRFLCPLVALALSDAETMGAYYLFISYFTFVVGITSLELAVPFSRKYLRCKSDKQRRLLFSGFMVNQAIVSTVLAIPAGALAVSWAGVPAPLIPLFCLALATEACVNEVGRFFWNIGEWKMPSLRDLIRAIIFATGILLSVYIENEILTPMTFFVLSAGNLVIILNEWRSRGGARTARNIHVAHVLKSSWVRAYRSMAGSIHQFLQMQLLGLQPLLERILIEKTLGLSTLASFSFLTSVMQSAASLQVVPLVAKARLLTLRAHSVSDRIEANRQAFSLGLKIAVISGGWGGAVYMSMPLLNNLLEKNLNTSPPLVFVAYFSSVSAIFCSAVAPMFTLKGLALPTNILTALAMGCLLLAQYFRAEGSLLELLLIICCVAVFQIIYRVLFIIRDLDNLKLRQ